MAILYNPTKKGEFFIRRSKRLLPTYFVTILLTLTISIFITIPNEYDQVATQSIYATFFSSNIGFWMQSSYFSKVEFNPLLHLWSLGVEIQFYLIVPILYWVFNKSKLFFPLVLFLSFAACFVIVGISPKTSFFMMPLRLWEFLMGYGVAIYFTNNGNIKNSSFSWIGMIAILLLMSIPTFNLNGESLGFGNGHPGLFALLVSLSTSIVLIFGIPTIIEKSKIGNLLGLLGKYSYSIYLVHFPVIVLFLYEPFSGTILKTNSIGMTLVLLGMIVFLSILMYHFIENPTRHSRKIIHNLLIFFPIILITIFLGYISQKSKYSKEEFAIFNAWKDRATYRCGKLIRILDPTALSCNLNTGIEDPIQRILFVGNSHADSIKSAFVSVASQLNVNVRFIVENNPLVGGMKPNDIINEAKLKKLNTIILHYSQKSLDKMAINAIKKLVDLAEKNNIFVTFIMPVPIWKDHIPSALYNYLIYKKPLPVQTHQDYDAVNKDIYSNLSQIEKNNFSIYEINDILCPEYCKFVDVTGKPYYFDDNHLTLTGAELLRPFFHKIITETLKIK